MAAIPSRRIRIIGVSLVWPKIWEKVRAPARLSICHCREPLSQCLAPGKVPKTIKNSSAACAAESSRIRSSLKMSAPLNSRQPFATTLILHVRVFHCATMTSVATRSLALQRQLQSSKKTCLSESIALSAISHNVGPSPAVCGKFLSFRPYQLLSMLNICL